MSGRGAVMSLIGRLGRSDGAAPSPAPTGERPGCCRTSDLPAAAGRPPPRAWVGRDGTHHVERRQHAGQRLGPKARGLLQADEVHARIGGQLADDQQVRVLQLALRQRRPAEVEAWCGSAAAAGRARCAARIATSAATRCARIAGGDGHGAEVADAPAGLGEVLGGHARHHAGAQLPGRRPAGRRRAALPREPRLGWLFVLDASANCDSITFIQSANWCSTRAAASWSPSGRRAPA